MAEIEGIAGGYSLVATQISSREPVGQEGQENILTLPPDLLKVPPHLMADPSTVASRGVGPAGLLYQVPLLVMAQTSGLPDVCNNPEINKKGIVVVKATFLKKEGAHATYVNLDKFPVLEACMKIPEGIELPKLWEAVRDYGNYDKFVDTFTWGKVDVIDDTGEVDPKGVRNPQQESVAHEFVSLVGGLNFHARVVYNNEDATWGYNSYGELEPIAKPRKNHNILLSDDVAVKIFRNGKVLYYRFFVYPALAQEEKDSEAIKTIARLAKNLHKGTGEGSVASVFSEWIARAFDPKWERGNKKPPQAEGLEPHTVK